MDYKIFCTGYRIGDTIYVSSGAFRELTGGKELDDLLTRFPSRNTTHINPRTLDGIFVLEALRRTGVKRIVDP